MTSLSDDAISALSEVKQIGEKLDDDHPMRHAARSMKRQAENILSNAFRQATELAYLAGQVTKDYDKAIAARSKEPE
jgi:hypothetical protein